MPISLTHLPPRPRPLPNYGFTLIELLIVITIIITLAGLVIGTMGYVQKKGARSRAEAEIAAMSAACESYKADNGTYPYDTNTNFLVATVPTPSSYATASLSLYKFISGDTNGDRAADQKSYFTFKPNMLAPSGGAGTVTAIQDPFGNSYGYSTSHNPDANPGGASGYNPTFDLWSTAGGTSDNDKPGWIKNW
jgi:general secretion pathway protein G